MTPTKSFISSIRSTIVVALGAVLLLGMALQPAMAKGKPQPAPSCSFTDGVLTATGLSARYPKPQAKTVVNVNGATSTITSNSYEATFTEPGDYAATFSTLAGVVKTSCSGIIEDTVVPDTTAPVLTLPDDIVAEEGPDGAFVRYTATATDDVDGPVQVFCDPASHTYFQHGVTTVTCIATDAASNSVTGTFAVSVDDTQPPTLYLPAGWGAEASSPDGTVIGDWRHFAEDGLDGDVPVTCDPEEGSQFPVGVTTVNCTATDAAGNVGTGSFNVTISKYTPADCWILISQTPGTNGLYPVTVYYSELTVGYEGEDFDSRFQARFVSTATGSSFYPSPILLSQSTKDPDTDSIVIGDSTTPNRTVGVEYWATFTTADQQELKTECVLSAA